jgi:hypothetical protein
MTTSEVDLKALKMYKKDITYKVLESAKKESLKDTQAILEGNSEFSIDDATPGARYKYYVNKDIEAIDAEIAKLEARVKEGL